LLILDSSLFLDTCRHFREHDAEERREDLDLTPEYFREVLLSYRLIFGQENASWKAFQKKLPTLEDHWDCSDRQSNDGDPMLRTLCGSSYTSPKAIQIYQAIDASDDVLAYYYPDNDFPFLGRRILNLQAYVSGRNPHNWRALWHDRRNVAFWWTFWVLTLNPVKLYKLANSLLGSAFYRRRQYLLRFHTNSVPDLEQYIRAKAAWFFKSFSSFTKLNIICCAHMYILHLSDYCNACMNY
jgi:hypothetical protein